MRSLFSLCAAAFCFFGVDAQAKENPRNCSLGSEVIFIDYFSDLPSAVQNDLQGRVAVNPDKDGIFNETDLRNRSYFDRRFIGAGKLGNLLFVWYEHGGRAYHIHVRGYWVKQNGSKSSSGHEPGANFVGPPCAATTALLSSVRSADQTDN